MRRTTDGTACSNPAMPNTAARLVAAALGATWLAIAVAGGARVEGPRGRNVVVVVVDTLRADRVGATRDQASLTPFLDELARRGTRFTQAYAASSWTNPSVASLFTSRYPSQHQVRGFGSTLQAEEATLAERLLQAGWLTAGFSANPQLAAPHGWDQGFDVWQTFPSFKLRGPELTAACLGWLDAHWSRESDRPLFLYLQYMEPHAPYEPPAALRARFAPGLSDEAARRVNDSLVRLLWADLSAADVATLASLYDGEVAAVDAELRSLFAALDARGVLDGALVVVTADHGEEFREHQVLAHGLTLYNQAMHVPLLVVGAPFQAGGEVAANVSLVDVAPTVLGLVGTPAEPRFEGRSLLPVLDGLAAPRDVLAELLTWQEQDWRQHEAAFIRGTRKLVVPPPSLLQFRQAAVFDLARDPLEAHPNPPDAALDAVLLPLELAATLARLDQPRSTAEQRDLGPEQRERLRALGYLQ